MHTAIVPIQNDHKYENEQSERKLFALNYNFIEITVHICLV